MTLSPIHKSNLLTNSTFIHTPILIILTRKIAYSIPKLLLPILRRLILPTIKTILQYRIIIIIG